MHKPPVSLKGRLNFMQFKHILNYWGASDSCQLCLLQKNVPTSSEVMVSLLQKLPTSSYWIILMTAGGHFAAAVFRGKEILTHKTFHRYTVRAKRGTAQGARDALQGGKQPK